MKMKFTNLTLQCRESEESISFSPRISFFHGKIASGKSSIPRLIHFCLGGDLERTPALQNELVSVQLSARIGEQDVLFERDAQGSNQVQVKWKDEKGSPESVLAPTQAGKNSIWGEEIYNISDLIFHLAGISPVKVPRTGKDAELEIVRLSFRDIMWYCYLRQEYLDSSFYNLRTPMLDFKSRYVMSFVVGTYSERLTELNTGLSYTKDYKMRKEQEATHLRSFLAQFGYGSESQIASEISETNTELTKASLELSRMRDGYVKDTHFADELRKELMTIAEKLSKEEQTAIELETRIAQQESLTAELLAAKSKLTRSELARGVLSGVSFDYCPSCGTKLTNKIGGSDICPLCGQHPSEPVEGKLPSIDAIKLDFDTRIKELQESIRRHKEAQVDERLFITRLRNEKSLGDSRLEDELKGYDSRFLSNSRDLERQIAALNERIGSLNRILEMPKAVGVLEKEVETLAADETRIRREIDKEKQSLYAASKLIGDIEDNYLQSLLAVGVPGVREGDQVKINRTTWIPEILPAGNEKGKWNFFNTGSAGKKTLLNVCFALSVHKVAAENNRPLPTFLIIDTPMKNIGEEVNKQIFESFYHHLYDLAESSLSGTQFIIIDKEYFPPTKEIEILERKMTPEDKENPPLISYYRGP